MLEEELNSDVQEVSSEPTPSSENQPEAQESAQAQQPDTQEQKQEAQPQDKYVPYNRFQEVITQKNQFAEQLKAMERQQAELQRQMETFKKPVAPKTEDPLIARLKGIDPEFGNRFEKLASLESQVAQFQQWQQQQQLEATRNQAYQSINKMHEDNKVDPSFREIYNAQIELAVLRNPKLSLDDLPNVYKDVHERLSKQFESLKRAERESYVTSKKADAKQPASQPKSAAVNPSKPAEWSKDPAEARAQLIKRVVAASKVSDNI